MWDQSDHITKFGTAECPRTDWNYYLSIPGFYQPVRRVRARNIHVTIMPFSRWTELFENTAMVAALIDHVAFRSYVLDMNGYSYQLMATIHK